MMIRLKLSGLLTLYKLCLALSSQNLAVIIIGQNDDYHSKLTEHLRNDLVAQAENSSMLFPQFFLYPQDINKEGGWAMYNLLPLIKKNISDNIEWIVFAEDRTKINLKLLLDTLTKYNSKKEMWIGHALADIEATIIHHFAFFKDPSSFKYPNFGSGFALTQPLLQRLTNELSKKTYNPPNFHIDVSHELALFITNKGTRNPLQHDEYFCTKEEQQCAAYPQKFRPCGYKAETTPLYAVKTFHKYHKNRVQIVQETWGQYTKDLIFFSDKEDTSIPTIKLDIENTEQGHCAKTIEIMKFLDKRLLSQGITSQGSTQWVILADDDTILSVSRISSLLACFHSTDSPIMIGERYRFTSNGDGYDYLTGGAGIAINRNAVEILAKQCKCPKADSPDDMILGACAKMFGISLVHFPYFHQARPTDYAEGYLATMDAVSFHKHWMLDPMTVYDEHFRKDDSEFFKNDGFKDHRLRSKQEL